MRSGNDLPDLGSGLRAGRGLPPHVLDLLPFPVMTVGEDRRISSFNRPFEMQLGPPGAGETCCSVLGCGGETASWNGCITELMLAGGDLAISGRTTMPDGHVWGITATRLAPEEPNVVYRLQAANPLGDAPVEIAEAAGEPRLRVSTLGATSVDLDGTLGADREWLGQRPGRLLKYLVIHRGRPVSADDIAEALWPRFALSSSGAARHAVHLLRRKLEPVRSTSGPSRFIATSTGRYALNMDLVWVDADAFETAIRTGLQAFVSGEGEHAERSLQHALDLYRGDFLPDDLYEDWAMDERERLRSLMQVPLRVLAELRLRRGDLESAGQYVEHLARLEPFDSDAHRLLIDIWLRLGQYGRALRRYELYRSRLMREFGVLPDFDIGQRRRLVGTPLHAL